MGNSGTPPFEAGVTPESLLDLHGKLLLLRQTELTLAEHYKKQEMRTPTHFGVGQEAVAVGVCAALKDGDVVYSHHRSHNAYLALGGGVYELAAELYGKEDGCSRGRGGSVHLTDRKIGLIGTSAIVAESIALAAGSAEAFAMDKSNHIAVAFFGDAVSEEGAFYETLNYASLRNLPVLFVCENNLYSTESPLSVRRSPDTDLCKRVETFKISARKIDGNDISEMHRVACETIEAIRAGKGPFFLECMTYRWLEHVGPYFDHELGRTYRDQKELKSWTKKCPVEQSEKRLLELGVTTKKKLKALSETIQVDVDVAIAKAHQAPFPEPSALFENV